METEIDKLMTKENIDIKQKQIRSLLDNSIVNMMKDQRELTPVKISCKNSDDLTVKINESDEIK